MATYQQAPSKPEEGATKWGVHWKSPTLMTLLFIAGIVFAIGHHVYYQSLDNTVVTSSSQQEWTIRIGTGLAFLVKASLAASVGIAFTQYLWTIARKKAMSVNSIDAMFSLTSDPLAFVNLEVLFKAKLLVLLALASWLMPFIATVTPGTLSVYIKMVTNTTDSEVPTTGFANDEPIWSDSMGVGYINEASPAVTRLLTAVSSSVRILPITAPYANSSFTLQFYAPALKCESLADAAKSGQPVGDCENCTSLETLWDSTIDNGLGANYLYYESVTPTYSHNLIFIRTGGGEKAGGETRNISCQLWNASYTTQFDFNDGIQTTTIQTLEYESTMDYNTSVPFTKLLPGGRAYLSMYLAMSKLLSGSVGFQQGLSSSGMLGSDLPVVKTGLMACPEILQAWKTFGSKDPPLDKNSSPWMCRNNSVAAAVEDLSRNFTLSLLSSQLLNGNTTTTVSVTSPKNFWRYNPLDLLISYVAGVAVALVCLFVGAWAHVSNGYSASTSFSNILLTTRNPDLDGIAVGQCLGAQPLNRNFGNTKLQFGVVRRIDGIDHAAFGIRGTVQQLKKGQLCC